MYREIFVHLNGEVDTAHQLAAVLDPTTLTPGALDLFGVDTLYNHPDVELRGTDAMQLKFWPKRETALRAFLCSAWTTELSDKAIFSREFNPRNQVLLETAPGFASATDDPGFREVGAVSYSCNSAEFSVESEKPSLFVLTDLHYPGWKAYVNGVEVPILKAYGFCRAVEVPAGKSEIRMVYRPTGWGFLVGSFVLGFLGCLVLTGVLRRK